MRSPRGFLATNEELVAISSSLFTFFPRNGDPRIPCFSRWLEINSRFSHRNSRRIPNPLKLLEDDLAPYPCVGSLCGLDACVAEHLGDAHLPRFIPIEAGKKMLIALVDMLRAMCVQCLRVGRRARKLSLALV